MPAAICEMTALEELYFRYVEGDASSIPACVGRLSNLTIMDYSFTSFTGTMPRGLCELTRLEKLQFQFTGGLTGELKGSTLCVFFVR